jgi:hypothetical protein
VNLNLDSNEIETDRRQVPQLSLHYRDQPNVEMTTPFESLIMPVGHDPVSILVNGVPSLAPIEFLYSRIFAFPRLNHDGLVELRSCTSCGAQVWVHAPQWACSICSAKWSGVA